MNLFIFLLIIISVSLKTHQSTVQDPLLKAADNSECIKEVIDTFIKQDNCQKLSQSQKTNLAIKMVNCLNKKLGKQQIPSCSNLKNCKVEGDNWNSFTTFFTHIDNLCHFYWDLLHHQRTESLIDGLSDSALKAKDILQQNYQSTEKILQTQQKIQSFMKQSHSSTIKLSESLKNSQSKLSNMTQNIEQFLQELNKNLLSQYSSIIKAMQTINQGIDGLNSVQSFMMSQINTMSGILYFLLQFLVILIITSLRFFKKNRLYSYGFLGLNILVEVIAPQFVLYLVGIKIIRIGFVLIHIVNLFKSFINRDTQLQQIKNYMDGRLDTQRIKRIFKEMIMQQKMTGNETKEN